MLDFSLLFGGERVPLSEFKLTDKPEIDSPELLTSYTTTNVSLVEGDTTLTEEQQEEISKWFEDRIKRDLERQMFGYPTEFQLSLRAAGVKV
jgi:hypothetical protein